MAIDFTSDPGGLMVRLGKFFKMIEDNRLWQRTTAETSIDDIYEQFVDSGEGIFDQAYIQSLLDDMDSERSGRDQFTDTILEWCREIISKQVDDQSVDPLPSDDDTTVLLRLLEEMIDQSETMDRPTVTIGTVTADGGNVGNGTILIDDINEEGDECSYIRSEPQRIELTAETGIGQFTIYGNPAISDPSDFNWPGGSGTGGPIPVCDPSQDGTGTPGAGRNVLKNSDFETFTGGLPAGWTAVSGVAQVDFDQETSAVYNGSKSLRLIGTPGSSSSSSEDGPNAPMLEQRINNSSTGTPGTVQASTKYCAAFRYKGSAANVGDGNFVVRVTVGDTVATFSDALGSGFPTVWTLGYVFFNTPDEIPAAGTTLKIEVGIAAGGDIADGEFIYVDDLILTRVLKHGQLSYVAVRGQTPFELEDKFSVTITNNGLHGGSSAGEFQFYFDMLYDMYSRNFVLPDNGSGTETIADSLIA